MDFNDFRSKTLRSAAQHICRIAAHSQSFWSDHHFFQFHHKDYHWCQGSCAEDSPGQCTTGWCWGQWAQESRNLGHFRGGASRTNKKNCCSARSVPQKKADWESRTAVDF